MSLMRDTKWTSTDSHSVVHTTSDSITDSERIAMKKAVFFLSATLFWAGAIQAQDIEGLIVETYYVSDANDATDTDGGSLTEGSVTYRVFLDLAEGVKLRSIFGSSGHPLTVNSTTPFFNNEDRGEIFGIDIGDNRVDENTVALDSWFTIGACTDEHWGIPKDMDPDGSIVGGVNNDGGSQAISGGLLVNEAPEAGVPLTQSDGLLADVDLILESVSISLAQGNLASSFGDVNSDQSISTEALTILTNIPIEGIGDDHILLIAQITTTGELGFALNVEVENEQGDVIRYVSNDDILEEGEALSPFLSYPFACGCTDPNYLEYDPSAPCDDGSCATLFVPGCTDPDACNYDPDANIGIDVLCCYGPEDCNGLDFELVCGATDVPDILEEGSIRLFPNPALDHIMIRCAECGIQQAQVIITDMSGVIVDGFLIAEKEFRYDVSKLPAGQYSLSLRQEDAVYYEMFIRMPFR